MSRTIISRLIKSEFERGMDMAKVKITTNVSANWSASDIGNIDDVSFMTEENLKEASEELKQTIIQSLSLNDKCVTKCVIDVSFEIEEVTE